MRELQKRIRDLDLKMPCTTSPKTGVIYSFIITSSAKVSEKTAARIMKVLGFVSRTVKKYKASTNSKYNFAVFKNELNQWFQVLAPNKTLLLTLSMTRPMKAG